jgi:antitoxin Phd
MAVKTIHARQKGRGAKAPRGAQSSAEARTGKAVPGKVFHAAAKPAQSWKLEDAKAKFSEVVRRAHAEGPQYVTVRGKSSVAVIDAAELERLLPARKPRMPFVAFMESLHIEGLDLTRDIDTGRDVNL